MEAGDAQGIVEDGNLTLKDENIYVVSKLLLEIKKRLNTSEVASIQKICFCPR